jgi:ketosteroid isomerase-like protein
MASTNVDLVRSIYAAWERGDFSSAEWAHPEIEYVIAGGPEPGKWTGIAGMAQGVRGILSAWEDFRSEAEEYRELDDEHILVLTRLSGRGKTSGMELEQTQPKGADLFEVCGGKVTRVVTYWERDRPLADFGLPPEGSSRS